VVQLLLNRDTRVAAKVQRSRVDGIVSWEGESTVALKNVPKSFDVQVGDVVLTSNYSNIFPANIVVGRVTRVEDENQTLFRRIVVEPAVDFSTLEQVYIIDYVPDQERIRLEREVEQRTRQRNADS
ncbi:MAG: rod shape-determining protein MreC, partial [Candidatus Kapabacteria bacterium]|nr:rod shape-determining protein MreC [Candidatus Kapabacteria bacterium]